MTGFHSCFLHYHSAFSPCWNGMKISVAMGEYALLRKRKHCVSVGFSNGGVGRA